MIKENKKIILSAGILGVGAFIAKLLGAIVFTTGLMMVVLTGSELFTGNVLMAFSVMEKKISIFKLFYRSRFVSIYSK